MTSLEIYKEYGFKFFLCRADKSPDIEKGTSWQDEKNHLTIDQVKHYFSLGRMIGGWIPENVIVLDVDRHEGKPDGLATLRVIKEQYNITTDFMDKTFVVKTAGKGLHIFFSTENEYRQNEKAPGLDLKTHKGYVIIAGSPGYEALNDFEPMQLSQELEFWLDSCEGSAPEKPAPAPIEYPTEKKLLPVKTLKRILNKIDATHFRDNGRWIEFVMSIKATCGDTEDVKSAILDWSGTDPEYSGKERQTNIRIDSTTQTGNITIGTFIHFLREEEITPHIVNQVVKLNTIGDFLVNAESQEIEIFFEVDYEQLSLLPEAHELFTLQGHTAAAQIMNKALNGKVIYVHGEKVTYYFDNNRWLELNDYYSILYTILNRVMKILYNRKDGTKEDNDNIQKCIYNFHTLYWKESAWKEFTRKDGVYKKFIEWDSPKIKETLTCLDGVIDFSGEKVIPRKGDPEEYRRFAVDYTIDEIGKAPKPEKFIEFLSGIIPDIETLETLQYYVSCMISGNASKRIFSIWKGTGKNGKSTLKEIIIDVLGKKMAVAFPVGLILQSRESESLGVTPEMAKLQGSFAAFTSEVDENQKLNTTKIKNLCGDETIQANPKHRDPIEFETTWQMILLCNDFPRFNASDQALIDRLLIIPFDVKYASTERERAEWISKGTMRENIKTAVDKKIFMPAIYAERAGIIRWMIEKYHELETKLNGVIPVSEQCIKLKNRYIFDNDDFGLFVKMFCDVDRESDYFVSNQVLTQSYRDFMDNQKLTTQYIVKGIINAASGVPEKTAKQINTFDEWGNSTGTKTTRGLQFIRMANKPRELDYFNSESSEIDDIVKSLQNESGYTSEEQEILNELEFE